MQCIITCANGTNLKPVLRYKVLILHNHHPDTVRLSEQACGDPWLFFEGKWGPRAQKSLGKTILCELIQMEFESKKNIGGRFAPPPPRYAFGV
jgi:hypothetical protein